MPRSLTSCRNCGPSCQNLQARRTRSALGMQVWGPYKTYTVHQNIKEQRRAFEASYRSDFAYSFHILTANFFILPLTMTPWRAETFVLTRKRLTFFYIELCVYITYIICLCTCNHDRSSCLMTSWFRRWRNMARPWSSATPSWVPWTCAWWWLSAGHFLSCAPVGVLCCLPLWRWIPSMPCISQVYILPLAAAQHLSSWLLPWDWPQSLPSSSRHCESDWSVRSGWHFFSWDFSWQLAMWLLCRCSLLWHVWLYISQYWSDSSELLDRIVASLHRAWEACRYMRCACVAGQEKGTAPWLERWTGQ